VCNTIFLGVAQALKVAELEIHAQLSDLEQRLSELRQ